jgi:hypothetical protein
VLVGRVPIMALGLNLEVLRGADFDPSTFGIFAFGVGPIVSAALLVELAAVVVPRWRPLRHGGYPGRSRLWTATSALALALAAMQAFFILRWMSSSPPAMGLVPETFISKSLVLVVPVVGQFVLLRLAELIDRHGTGHGLSVLIVAFALPTMTGVLTRTVAQRLAGDDRGMEGMLILALMAIVAVVVSVARRPGRGWERHPPRPELLTPAAGVLPYTATLLCVGFPVALRPFVRIDFWPTEGTPLYYGLEVVMLVGFSALFTRLLNRPGRVAALWRRGPGQLDEPTALEAARAAFGNGFGRAVALGLALAGVRSLGLQAHVGLDPLMMAVIGCVAVDLAGERRFRRDHGAVTAVWPLHRTYAVGPALSGLAAAGIPAFPRALRHGALVSFWGPYVPVELLVPAPRAEEAQALMRALMAPSGS